jgi:hypothetical protein
MRLLAHAPKKHPEALYLQDFGLFYSYKSLSHSDPTSLDGALSPIVWKSYIDKVNKMQGAISNKSEVQKRFEDKLSKSKKGECITEEWADLDKLLNMLFSAFIDDEG